MFRTAQCTFSSSLTRYYSTLPSKPPLKLVAELRKLTEVSITKAQEALSASNNDVNRALEWLQKDLVMSGAKKAAKVGSRFAGEGLISTSILSNGIGSRSGFGGIRAAMVELNCETDFVGRNELFGRLAADIAHTAAYLADPQDAKTFRECPLDALNDAPLIPQHQPDSRATGTVGSSIRDLIAKVGEKVSLQRAVTIIEPPPRPHTNIGVRLGSYNHGSINLPSQGRIGSLVLLAIKSQKLAELVASEPFQCDLEKLERSLARQIAGFETTSITSSGEHSETALYDQPPAMFPGESAGTVLEVLHSWAQQRGLVQAGQDDSGVIVLDFKKWVVGETALKSSSEKVD